MLKLPDEDRWATERPADGETVARMHEVIRTSSSAPAIVETRSGELFVLKLAGGGAGPRGLLTEFLAAGIAKCVGLPVPAARPLLLPKDFPWQIGTDEFDDMLQRSYGWNLGIALIPDAEPVKPDALGDLPADFLTHLAFADRLLQNVDRTAKNPNLLRSPQGIFAIDFGSCLFLNRIATRRTSFPFALPQNHFLAGTPRAAASPLLGASDVTAAIEVVPHLIQACPAEWIASLPFKRQELEWRLIRYLEASSVR
jgi:hypothetical protein